MPVCIPTNKEGKVKLQEGPCCPCLGQWFHIDCTITGLITWSPTIGVNAPLGMAAVLGDISLGDPMHPTRPYCDANSLERQCHLCCANGTSIDFTVTRKINFNLAVNPSNVCGISAHCTAMSRTVGDTGVGLTPNSGTGSAAIHCGGREDQNVGLDCSCAPSCGGTGGTFPFSELFGPGGDQIGFDFYQGHLDGNYYMIPIASMEIDSPFSLCLCGAPTPNRFGVAGFPCPPNLVNLGPGPLDGAHYNLTFHHSAPEAVVGPPFSLNPAYTLDMTYDLTFS